MAALANAQQANNNHNSNKSDNDDGKAVRQDEDGGLPQLEAAPVQALEPRPSEAHLAPPQDKNDKGQEEKAGFKRRRGLLSHSARNEEAYFSSYARLSIHYDMLSDRVRTESYRDCIEGLNRSLFKDKVVLDVGCGTGILSMFAARAGARKVIGVDLSDIIDKAREIVAHNGLADRVVLVKGKVEEVVLPVEEVDVIVSEWMGYFLLFESMLDTVLFARDRWLKRTPNGQLPVFPNQAEMFISASCLARSGYWNDVYGFDYAPIVANTQNKEAEVEVVDPADTISNVVLLKRLDVQTVGVKDLDFVAEFRLVVEPRKALLRAFVSHFDCVFSDLTGGNQRPIVLSTSPVATPTHWRQTVFPLDEAVEVASGCVIQGTLSCCKSKSNPRAIDVCIDFSVRDRDGKLLCKKVQMFEV